MHDTSTQTFIKSGTIQVILAIASVITTLLGAYITSRLAPLQETNAVLTEKVQALSDKETANEAEHAKLASVDSVSALAVDVKGIKIQVNELYTYFLGRK